MKLTPLDIRHKEFRRAMRGYSDEEVDVFLDEVADEFERVFRENIEAQERIHRLEERVSHYEGLRETLQNTLVSAQRQADEMRANARKESELILKDAELKGRDIVGESYSEKQRVQQALIQLKQVEEDFRFKFRSLLEAHLNLLAEDEVSDERRRFRGLVSSVEQELESGDAEPVKAPTRPAAARPWAEVPVSPAVSSALAATPAASGVAAESAAVTDPPDASAPAAPEGDVFGVPAAPDASTGEIDEVQAFLETEANAPESAASEEEAPWLDADGQQNDEAPSSDAEDDFEELESEAPLPPADDRKESSVRRFLFGKRPENEPSDGFFEDQDDDDRDFRW
ncbi:MAG: DivIVA domain-containing protein [Thermoleophilia bacterium]|nr:DivIVA domain-containing protein [Thermoleophilia bacterium]